MASNAPARSLTLLAQFWTLGCAAYLMWEGLAYRGLSARLAEFQIDSFGSYAPLLTFLVLFGLAVIPVWIIVRLLARRGNALPDTPAETAALRLTQARRLRLMVCWLGAGALVVCLGFVVYAAALLPGQSGRLQTIAASELGTIAVTEGPSRLVGGELGPVVLFGQGGYLSDDRIAFAPYRPASAGQGIAQVFVQVDLTTSGEAATVSQRPAWSGILVEGGLPGTARSLFRTMGVGIADPYYTLYQNEQVLKSRYWLQALQWALLAAFFGVLVALQTRTIRTLTGREADLPAQPAMA